MEKIITFIKGVKEFVGNLPGKWQSKNSNYKNTYMVAGMFILLSGICRLYVLFASSGSDYIDIAVKYVFAYLGFLLIITSVTMLVWDFYINNSIKKIEKAGHFFLLLSLIISMLALSAAIPAIVIYIVFHFIIDRRAK
ncbi:MAG: hypothetical protein K2K56_13755, partial [Lachnospiraceae bacterium]|nr:hypothetical protein [Lachnospiraceae bacterium]